MTALESSRKRYADLVSRGICVRCLEPHKRKTQRCRECTTDGAIDHNKRRLERRRNGQCHNCNEKAAPGRTQCRSHTFKAKGNTRCTQCNRRGHNRATCQR